MTQKSKYLIFKIRYIASITNILSRSILLFSYEVGLLLSIGLEATSAAGSPDLQPVLVNLPDYVLCQFIENIIMPVYIQLMSVYYYN